MRLRPNQMIGIASGVAGASAFGITATGARDWLDTIATFVQHPAAVVVLILLIAVLLGWLFVRSSQSNEDCEQRVQQLQKQNNAQQNQLDAIHLLLRMDRRYADRMPSIEAWRAGTVDLAMIASAGQNFPERRDNNRG